MRMHSGMPRPVYDETLTSWLSRLIDLERLDEVQIGEVVKRLASRTNGDIDALVMCPMLPLVLDPPIYEIVKYRFTWPSSPLLSFEDSDVYCAKCLEADIAAGRAPSWRVSWRIQGICICSSHSSPVLLRRLETSRFTWKNKAWLAFSEYVSSPASRLMVDFAISKSVSHSVVTRNLILLSLIYRAQWWKLTKVDRGQIREISPPAVNGFLYICLWQNVEGTGVSGFARQFFRPLRNGIKTPSAHSGVGVSSLLSQVDMAHLGVAYLMLGISYGIINRKEAELVRNFTFSPSWVFPIDRHEVGLMARQALGSEALMNAHAEIEGSLPKQCFQQIAWVFG